MHKEVSYKKYSTLTYAIRYSFYYAHVFLTGEVISVSENDDGSNTSMSDASALRAFQARMLAAQPQMAASQNQTGRRGSGGRRHTLCLTR